MRLPYYKNDVIVIFLLSCIKILSTKKVNSDFSEFLFDLDTRIK